MVVALLLPRLAAAEPEFQLYIPGANYASGDPDAWRNEGWVWDNTMGTTFELWLLAYNTKSNLDNVQISVAVHGEQLEALKGDPALKVSWVDGASVEDKYLEQDRLVWSSQYFSVPDTGQLTLGAGSFALGTPKLGDPFVPSSWRDMAAHGVYPTEFAELYIGHLDTASGTDGIWDAQVDPTNIHYDGVVYKLLVEVDPRLTCIHFDAHNGSYDPKVRAAFAPFSHDCSNYGHGDGAEPIPEPTSMAFLGSIFVGGFVRVLNSRRRKKAV